jgi:GNAT superfamily N-acetyltransferase
MGYTKRANSITALNPTDDFRNLRPAFEHFALDHDIPCTIRITPLAPPGTDRACDTAGYRLLDPTLVMTIPSLQDIPLSAVQDTIRHTSSPDKAWLDGYAASSGVDEKQREAHEAILACIQGEATFASIVSHSGARDQAAAMGYAVLDHGMIGLFDILVDEGQRGRGLGRSVVLALLDWGRRRGAQGAYLQVVEGNLAARRLYEGLGFVDMYRYHYRQAMQHASG